MALYLKIKQKSYSLVLREGRDVEMSFIRYKNTCLKKYYRDSPLFSAVKEVKVLIYLHKLARD